MSQPTDFFSTTKFKMMLLAGMVLQNSATVLVGRYTRAGVPEEDRYVVNHLIVVTEIGKLLLSCAFEWYTTNGLLMKSIQENIIEKPFDALKIMIPALLYLVQNTLLYVALSNLTAPLFQVTYQGKLVTTAIVSVIMLNRKYTFQQWICLVTLSVGVAVVVLDEKSDDKKAEESQTEQSLFVGLISVTIACLSSALAGVYFEKVIKSASGEKQKPVSVWMRNIQLALFTIIIALGKGIFSGENSEASSLHYLHGFTFWPWVLVCLQAGGGLLVAAVIKYADNVLKGLATAVSVCFATAMSFVLFHTPITGQFLVGAVVILASVYFFSNPIKKESVASPVSSPSKSVLPK
jgi:UDP-sugar transporter A1/2/3